MSHFTVFSTILLLILTFSIGENKDIENGFSKALCQVTLQLERGLRKDGENLFVSPMGIVTALGMVYLGAKRSSARQIYQGLHFNEFANSKSEAKRKLKTNLEQYKTGDRNNYTLDLANQLFLKDGFEILEKFQKDMATFYSAPIQQVDFGQEPSQAAEIINHWVSDNTNGMIKELFKPEEVNPSWILVLANAIYFHGFWENAFKAELTEVESFNKLDGSKEQTSFMNQHDTFFAYKEFPQLKAKVLQMNYIGKDIKMTVILPDETSGLYGVIGRLTVETLQQMLGDLPLQKVNLKFPKFKFEAEYSDELEKTLKTDMGISDIFTGKADLSGISETAALYVELIKHKAIVDVDETGTKAAAVTGIGIFEMSLISPVEIPRDFIADHPFMFIISDNRNGAILFCGTYLTPPA